MSKVSPIAQYLRDNRVISLCSTDNPDIVKFINSEGKIIGRLKKEQDINFSRFNIDLFKPGKKEPFMSMMTIISKNIKYFLKEHKFLPVSIKTTKIFSDYTKNSIKKDEHGKGLKQNLYIDKIKESTKLAEERISRGLPENFPIYEINKPFRYETKYIFHYPPKTIINPEYK